MIRACLFLLAGVYALQLSSFARDSDLIAVVLIAFCVALELGKFRLLLLSVAGTVLFLLATLEVISSRIPHELVGDSVVVQVRIVEFPKRSGLNVSFVAKTADNSRLPQRVRISWHEPPVAIRLGDVWQFELRLRRPRGSSNPGAFDYEAWLLRQHVGAIGYVVSGRRNHLLRSGDLSAIERMRQRVVDRVTAIVPEIENAAVLAAISVGARHLVTAKQWDRYARTGTSHLMAISGLHVGLAAAGGYFLAAVIACVLRLRVNQHFAATAAALSVAVAYALISGLAVPAQRASLMIATVAAAVLWRRQIRPLRTIAAACVLIIVLSPLATMAPGFKLSFTAVLVLIWLARRYPGKHKGSRYLRPLSAVRQLGAVQVLLLLGLLPLSVLIFGRIVLAAPIVNLIAVPVFSFVTVPFTFAGLILDGVFQPLGDRALLIAAISLEQIEMLIAGAALVPGASHATPAITGAAWLYIALPLAWVVFPPGWPGRCIAWIAVVAVLLYTPTRPPRGCTDIDVLDVGQGLAIVVRTSRHVVVFDTGPAFRGGNSAAETIVLPYLASFGVTRIDTLVVSHADLDHAGGVTAIHARVRVLDTIVGENLTSLSEPGRPCLAGDSWRFDGISFSFVHPPVREQYEGNNASCVLMISAGDHDMLITGDIERPVEEELVRAGTLPVVDAVIVPHHGSRTSSTPSFVRALSPATAIVSTGYGNRWGFPKKEVVDRWQAVGAVVLTTATSGAIGIRLCEDGGVVSLSRHRDLRRRIWHE
jgi:competence protein ComEC